MIYENCDRCGRVLSPQQIRLRTQQCKPCTDVFAAGRQAERQRVVAWLNAGSGVNLTSYEIADAIEHAEHIEHIEQRN